MALKTIQVCDYCGATIKPILVCGIPHCIIVENKIDKNASLDICPKCLTEMFGQATTPIKEEDNEK